MTTAPVAVEQPAPRRGRRRRRIAAIDVGTNSIHMIVVEALRHSYRVIDREKEMVQLGRGSLDGRPLTDKALELGIATLAKMAEIARRWEVDDIVAVATSAIREAPNRRRFLSAVEKAAGLKVRVISGEEEADYIYRAVRAAVDFHDGTALMIDIGGGSVELIVGTADEVFFTRSEPAGALRTAQKFGLDGPASAATIDRCRAAVRRAMRKTTARIRGLGFDFAIGTSGTVVALATLTANAGEDVASGLQWLSRARLSALIDELAPLPAEERAKRFSLDPQRAETILAGAVVLEQIMDGLSLDRLRACDAALREGIVEHALDLKRDGKPAGGGSVRRSSVLALADRSNIDRAHAAHVGRLALRIFDQTHELHGLGANERELLDHAALLHEVGMHVAYSGHHRHSYYVISHAGLRGFTSDQVSVLANVARYYRKSPPTDEHSNFASLSEWRRDVVCKLAAILRIAAALDRGRRGAIRDLAVSDDGAKVVFHLRPRGKAELELEAAEKKAKYFGKVFDRKVDLELAPL